MDYVKLWIDDLRTPPAEGWLWAKTSQEAVNLLDYYDIEEASLDHDLGHDDTSRRVILWLCEHTDKWPKVCRVHSANPVGIEWLEGMINRYGPSVSKG